MGKFTDYKVQLASLTDGHHEQDFVCGTEFFKNMENAEIQQADIKVHLDLEKRHDVYDLTFTCRGTLVKPCDRCLDPLEHEVDTTYHITVKYGEEFDDASDDLLVIPENQAFLNVAYMLYDTIVLTIPMRHVHPMGKCNRAMAAVISRHNTSGSDDDTTAEDLADELADEAGAAD